MTDVDIRPWQKQPEGDWQTWTVWGPRGTGKTWALHRAAIERAHFGGERVAFFTHPSETPRRALDAMALMVANDFDLNTEEDVQISWYESAIHFRSGGVIEVNPDVQSGASPKSETVLLDQREPGSILIPFHEMRRVGCSMHAFVPHSEHTLRDAT